MRECEIDGCGKKLYARGWCGMHYQRNRILGDPGEPRPRFIQKAHVMERVDAYTVVASSGCWLWTGTINRQGYAKMSVGRSPRSVHRVVYEWFVGPIESGLEIDHLCRVRHCVNPAHLEAVTHHENGLRGEGYAARNARKTHCKRGHLLEGDNLKPDPRLGRRICKECVHMHRRDRYLRLGR